MEEWAYEKIAPHAEITGQGEQHVIEEKEGTDSKPACKLMALGAFLDACIQGRNAVAQLPKRQTKFCHVKNFAPPDEEHLSRLRINFYFNRAGFAFKDRINEPKAGGATDALQTKLPSHDFVFTFSLEGALGKFDGAFFGVTEDGSTGGRQGSFLSYLVESVETVIMNYLPDAFAAATTKACFPSGGKKGAAVSTLVNLNPAFHVKYT